MIKIFKKISKHHYTKFCLSLFHFYFHFNWILSLYGKCLYLYGKLIRQENINPSQAILDQQRLLLQCQRYLLILILDCDWSVASHPALSLVDSVYSDQLSGDPNQTQSVPDPGPASKNSNCTDAFTRHSGHQQLPMHYGLNNSSHTMGYIKYWTPYHCISSG